MKKTSFYKLIALLLLVAGGAAAQAQPITMGANPIYFGNGCQYSFIQNTGFNQSKLAFGYNSACFGPFISVESIWFDLNYGRIGLGTSSPSYKLHLTQNSAAKPGSSYWTVISDRRYKTDVKPYEDGMELIRNIDPVSFRYKKGMGIDSDEEFVGVIAQDLQTVAPYMVKPMQDEEGDSEYLAVDLHALDFAVVNALQELDRNLSALQAQNEQLMEKVTQLENQLASKQASAITNDATAGPRILSIAPNPGDGFSTVRFALPKGQEAATVELLNLQGQVLRQVKTTGTEVQLDLHGQAAGRYVVRVTDAAGQSQTQSLVIAH